MIFVSLILIVSIVAITIFSGKLDRALQAAPVVADSAIANPFPQVAVVIPAYNEAANIEACVTSVLDSTTIEHLQVWVIDDQSTDETREIVELLQASRHDSRLHLISAGERPAGEVWVGKNWACTQAAKQIESEFLLFIDADVRLKSQSIEKTIAHAQQEKIDLLSLAPAILCRHWSEWLVQPIVVLLLAVGFDFAPVNDPMSETAFAAGPFMLFRRSAYDAIGGHAAVHDYVVEDVELSRRIKQQNFRLWYGLGRGLAEVQMYRSFSALWEGWTKNWFEGSNRNYQAAFYCIFVTFIIFSMPLVGLTIALSQLAFSGFTIATGLALGLSSIALFQHYVIRLRSEPYTLISTNYWWAIGVGGLLVCAIVLTSIVKTVTGWGWTWRGRQLG
ncbi:glycosyltransferase [Pseudanabaenaceae cyanobacterium LEGE 13415]|nr:glycosyltransferase [Pseudanabaenaceae cyanobacterium LEGE 13415]